MAWFAQQVYAYSKDNSTNTWSTTPLDISKYSRNTTAIIGYGKKKDSFSFFLSNPNNKFYRNNNSQIKVDDKVRIWFKRNSSTMATSDLIIEGVIQRISYNNETQEISINGGSFIERLFAGQVFLIGQINKTSNQLIQEVIKFINGINPNRKIRGQDSSEWTTLGNDTTSLTHDVDIDYEMGIELVTRFSSPEYTDNGWYIFYVTPDGTGNYDFIWKRRDPTNQSTITETTSEMYKMSIVKDNEETVNFIIYKVKDVYGTGIWYPNFNASSINSAGGTTKLITETLQITEDLLRVEFEASSSAFASTTVSGKDIANKPQFPTSYPYTFQFKTRNEDGTTSGTAATASSNSQFNSAILTEARWRGYEQTQEYLQSYSYPLARAEVEFSLPSTAYAIGNMHGFEVPSYNFKYSADDKKALRIQQITYKIDTVNIDFEQDPEKADMS